MPSVCDVCDKRPGFGRNVPKRSKNKTNRGWANHKTNRRWDPNIQPVRVATSGGDTMQVHACTSCIKAGKVK